MPHILVGFTRMKCAGTGVGGLAVQNPRSSLGCWHAYPVGVSAALTLAPGSSPWRLQSAHGGTPAYVTDGDGRAGCGARDPPFGTPSRSCLAVHASPRFGHSAPGIWALGSLIEGLAHGHGAGLHPPGWAVRYRLAVVLTLAAAPRARSLAAARGVRPGNRCR